MNRFVKRSIVWMIRRSDYSVNIIDSKNVRKVKRFCPFWIDEFTDDDGDHWYRPPWYRPFNILLHCWRAGSDEVMHDHPRWSITIVLAGKIIEHTPWGRRVLTPGSIVIRSTKYIHLLEMPQEFNRKTWTLFIVGRRNHLQNYYEVKAYDREY